MGSLLGRGGGPVERGMGALPSLPWWGRGGGRAYAPGPYHLPLWKGVTRYTCCVLVIRVDPGTYCMLLMGPGPLGSVSYLLVLLTRLVFNPHTAYSDVGGTLPFLRRVRSPLIGWIRVRLGCCRRAPRCWRGKLVESPGFLGRA
jgi:hypothetical protein